MTMSSSEEMVFIEEVATIVDRAAHTVRMWVLNEQLPEDLMPDRVGGRRRLVWARGQIPGLEEFAKEKAAKKGWQH